jgi:hypothetical protein
LTEPKYNLYPARKEANLTPSIVIVDVVAHFKRRISTPVESHVPCPSIKAHVALFFLSQPPILSPIEVVVRPSTMAVVGNSRMVLLIWLLAALLPIFPP